MEGAVAVPVEWDSVSRLAEEQLERARCKVGSGVVDARLKQGEHYTSYRHRLKSQGSLRIGRAYTK